MSLAGLLLALAFAGPLHACDPEARIPLTIGGREIVFAGEAGADGVLWESGPTDGASRSFQAILFQARAPESIAFEAAALDARLDDPALGVTVHPLHEAAAPGDTNALAKVLTRLSVFLAGLP